MKKQLSECVLTQLLTILLLIDLSVALGLAIVMTEPLWSLSIAGALISGLIGAINIMRKEE